MGQQESVPGSLLDRLLRNFSDFQRRAKGNGGPPSDPEFLRTLSQLEWLTFTVRWPTEGTFDLPTLFAVRATVHRVPHPDQHLYVDIWVNIATERPGYIRKCMQGNREGRRSICLVAGKNQQRGKEGPCDDLDPGQLQNKPRLVPVLPEQREDSLDPVNAPPPYYRREEPDFSRQGNGEAVSPPHTRGGAMCSGGGFPPAGSAAILPLREAPPAPDAPPPRLIYVPLSTSDLYN